MRPNPLFRSTQEIASNMTQFYSQVHLYNQLCINLVYCFFSKWFSKLIKKIWYFSCYIQKLLREGDLVQIHFNLSTSTTQDWHLFGLISVLIGPVASVSPNFLIHFQVPKRNPFMLRITGYLISLPTFQLERPAALFSSFISIPNSWWYKRTERLREWQVSGSSGFFFFHICIRWLTDWFF